MVDKPKSRSKASISASSILGLGKAEIVEPKENGRKSLKVPRITPVDFGFIPNEAGFDIDYLDESKTMGFIAPPNIITNLIKLITLPYPPKNSKHLFEFKSFVLHFDDKRGEIWWSNEASDGNCINFGYATYDYFEHCWGNGEIVLEASELLKLLKHRYHAQQLMLLRQPYEDYVQLIALIRKTSFITYLLQINYDYETLIENEKPRVDYERYPSKNPLKLDDDYVPIRPNDEALKYGGSINTSQFKIILENARKGSKIYSYENCSLFGLDEMIIISKKLEALAYVLEGDVIFKFSENSFMPDYEFYLLKEEKNKENPDGVMKAGILIRNNPE